MTGPTTREIYRDRAIDLLADVRRQSELLAAALVADSDDVRVQAVRWHSTVEAATDAIIRVTPPPCADQT